MSNFATETDVTETYIQLVNLKHYVFGNISDLEDVLTNVFAAKNLLDIVRGQLTDNAENNVCISALFGVSALIEFSADVISDSLDSLKELVKE